MNIQYIRDKYRVPAKRGGCVRTNYGRNVTEGRITGTPRSHVRLNMVTADGQKLCLHPFELDYLVDDQWVSGKDLQTKYDAAWDRINESFNQWLKSTKTT